MADEQKPEDAMDAEVQGNNALVDIFSGVQTAYDAGPTYTAPGSTTQQSWEQALGAAGNPSYSSGVSVGLDNTAQMIGNWGLTDTQAGNISGVQGIAGQYGQNAATALDYGANGLDQLYSDVTNDTLGAVNKAYNNSGIAGSTANYDAAAQGVASALAPLQLDQYNKQAQYQMDNLAAQAGTLGQSSALAQQGTDNLGALAQTLGSYYGLNQAPSTVASTVGTAQDAAASAESNQYVDWLGSLTSALGGTTGAAGTSTPTSWMDFLAPLLSIGATAL
jgi:hypothetical protein